jgi:uncharacterized protein (DUF488 family)
VSAIEALRCAVAANFTARLVRLAPAANNWDMASDPPLTIWTVGHSTRSKDEFLELLHSQQIQLLVDVRRFPGSRKYPHFNEAEMAHWLDAVGIGYRLAKDLGGRRTPRADSHNTAWRNASFRAYADYMETGEFQAAAEELLGEARMQRTAIMCSEAVWWRCHRSLIADYLKIRGLEVLHILSLTKIEPHPFTSAASIVEGQLSYAADEGSAARQQKLF